ncbi:MAG: SCO family protein [Flavobacteriaceae bacterium]|nr:SCO family protein [Bacteroidia bacterium]NNL15976.1 SCO family protein [Flavobacteriaceae bacterium]
MKIIKLVLLILLVASCKNHGKTLPVLSYKINEEGIKEFYTISYDGFVNQFGQPFSTNNIKGKTCVANFFFTRCPSICPPMKQQLIKLSYNMREYDEFIILSHTIDMEYDSVDVLHEYWKSTEVPESKWQFLRATESITKEQANLFMTNFRPNEDGTDFYHSTFVALIDKEQQIRGFYNTISSQEMERLINDVKLLCN